ncbi:DNA-directed RNA polymerase II subunit rpb4 [Cichlidogyrus casuarinus]|uniref:DNA-directed RNA polymerase II subunit rpb4 n=1 Tax=Cichlidogyrus casuarinus TaxID=1844966 RepID=A0ABD2Q4M0_9PLAT
MSALQDEYDAAELKFPPEFEKGEALMLSEVKYLLEHRKAQNDNNSGPDIELPPTFTKTLNYVMLLSKFTNRETIESVRNLLAMRNFHSFQLASIANLLPETSEEAKCLISSLDCPKYSDEELQQVLDEIQSKRSFQTQ